MNGSKIFTKIVEEIKEGNSTMGEEEKEREERKRAKRQAILLALV